jgi:hypothetical protein
MVDLNTLMPPNSGWIRLLSADGINDAGQIVGLGKRPGNDVLHGFLLTPDDTPVAALVTATPRSAEVNTLAIGARSANGNCLDLREVSQAVESFSGLVSPSEVTLVALSAGHVALSAKPTLIDGAWLDPLPDRVV